MVTKNCQQIEELILKQINEELKEKDIDLINKHIENCSSCSAFKLSLVNIEKSMNLDNDASLQPNSTIKQVIINQMQQKFSGQRSWLWNFIKIIKSIFGYRIPVYQAGLAMLIIVFLITIGMDYTKSIQDQNEYTQVNIQNTNIPLNSDYIIDNYPDLENQKVGVNVREDSILIGFIYTSM